MDIHDFASRVGLFVLVALTFGPRSARAAETFQDSFSPALSPSNWTVQLSPDLPHYTVDASAGFVRVCKSIDTTHTGNQALWVQFAHPVVGNFTAEIQYHNAFLQRVSGGPGNDIALLARFSAQSFAARRASETGPVPESYYAWADPPGFAYGRLASIVNAGTLRIERQSILVSVIADGATLFTGVVDGDTLQSIAFGLENRGTTDSTSVEFDDFVLTADQILWSAPVTDVAADPVFGAALAVSPNPARGRLAVRLDLAVAAELSITLVDVQGRAVARVHQGALTAGRHELSWDPPAALGPGLYFVVADVPGGTLRARVVIAR